VTRPELPVLFQDGDVIAFDKPEGLPVIPERLRRGPSALEIAQEQTGGRLFVVHRIDRDTSGVLLFARHADAHRHLNGEFLRHRVRKSYLAVVHGRMPPQARVSLPLRQFGSGRMGVDRKRGKPSLTRFRRVGLVGSCSEVVAQPVTGRRHQIRVHLYSLGHPVVGDRRYGDPALRGASARLLLHARSLSLRLPSGRIARLNAPVPRSFSEVVESLRRRDR
jgi:tRNA pseudouridine32 synthase/23S rRNA pseudouridine746 synthase